MSKTKKAIKVDMKEAWYEKKLIQYVADELAPKEIEITLSSKDVNVHWYGKHLHSEDNEILLSKSGFINRVPGAEILH